MDSIIMHVCKTELNMYYISADTMHLRINGKVYYNDVGDLVRSFIKNGNTLETNFVINLIKKDIMCSFTTNDELIHNIAEYLI